MIQESEIPKLIVERIFTDEGPRGSWGLASYKEPTMQKIIEAGRFGLMQYRDEVNSFLSMQMLPEAVHFGQEEFEGCLKYYFMLNVEKSLYDEKILPVKMILKNDNPTSQSNREKEKKMQFLTDVAQSALKGIPKLMIKRIFSDEGPRGSWGIASYKEPTMQKILEAGNFGLMQYIDEVNSFLSMLRLPEAVHFGQEEFEGRLKYYFMLNVEKSLYNEKILPVKKILENEKPSSQSTCEKEVKLKLLTEFANRALGGLPTAYPFNQLYDSQKFQKLGNLAFVFV